MSNGDILQVDPPQLQRVAQQVGELPALIRAEVHQPLQVASEAAVQGWQPGTAVATYQNLVEQQLQHVQLLHQQIEEWSTLLAQQVQAYVQGDMVSGGGAQLGAVSGEGESDLLRGLTSGQAPTQLNLTPAEIAQLQATSYFRQAQTASQQAFSLNTQLETYANAWYAKSGKTPGEWQQYNNIRYKTVAVGVDSSGTVMASPFTVSGWLPSGNRQYVADAYQAAFGVNPPNAAANVANDIVNPSGRLYNQGYVIPNSEYPSHAERQMAWLMDQQGLSWQADQIPSLPGIGQLPGQIIGISQPPCDDCIAYFSVLSRVNQRAYLLAGPDPYDPAGAVRTFLFTPTGYQEL
jgi:hypothetical protein